MFGIGMVEAIQSLPDVVVIELLTAFGDNLSASDLLQDTSQVFRHTSRGHALLHKLSSLTFPSIERW